MFHGLRYLSGRANGWIVNGVTRAKPTMLGMERWDFTQHDSEAPSDALPVRETIDPVEIIVHPPAPQPEFKPSGFVLHRQHVSRIGFRAAQLDRSAIDRQCELSGAKADELDSLRAQLQKGWRMLFREPADQRTLYDFATAERIDDCSVKAVRAYRKLQRRKESLATRRAALRIIETAKPIPVESREDGSRKVKPLKSVLASGIKRMKDAKPELSGWNPDA